MRSGKKQGCMLKEESIKVSVSEEKRDSRLKEKGVGSKTIGKAARI